MWRATVDGIDVPECNVELYLLRGVLVLHIDIDFPELDKLKALPSSSYNMFAVNIKEDLVSVSCDVCWLISFELYNSQTDGSQAPELVARLVFAFKRTDKDRLSSVLRRHGAAPF